MGRWVHLGSRGEFFHAVSNSHQLNLRLVLFDFPECRRLCGSEQRIRQDHRRSLFTAIGGDPEGAFYPDLMLRNTPTNEVGRLR